MKRIDVIVQPGVGNKIVTAIKKIGVGGVTISSVQGQGAAEPPLVGQYFSKETVMTVVDDNKVDSILDAVAGIACTGTKGDGKVFISPVEDAFDICTRKRGSSAI